MKERRLFIDSLLWILDTKLQFEKLRRTSLLYILILMCGYIESIIEPTQQTFQCCFDIAFWLMDVVVGIYNVEER